MGHFEPQKLSKLYSNLKFQLKTIEKIKNLANEITKFRQLPFINHQELFWPERYNFIINYN